MLAAMVSMCCVWWQGVGADVASLVGDASLPLRPISMSLCGSMLLCRPCAGGWVGAA